MKFSESNTWRPNIVSAIALDESRFCIVLSRLEYDDPFSAILMYDGNFSQPWERTDVAREITNLATLTDQNRTDGNNYIILSNEGDVYFIGGETQQERIPGAGIQSVDATGLGAMFVVSDIEGRIFAAGAGAQLYERLNAGWKVVPINAGSNGAYAAGEFAAMAGSGQAGIYLAGIAYPSESLSDQVFEPANSWEDYDRQKEQRSQTSTDAGVSKKPKPVCYFYNNANWQVIDLKSATDVKDIFVESPDKIWLAGADGTLLSGSAEDGFRNVSFSGDRDKNLLSITKFQNRLIVASDYGLHSFDDHLLSPIRPKLNFSINKGVPTPLKVQAVGDLLFYFDYKHGVHRFDGRTWEEIIIPPELLEREFNGLPPTK